MVTSLKADKMTLEPKLTGGLTSDSNCRTFAYQNQSKSRINLLFKTHSYVVVLGRCKLLPGTLTSQSYELDGGFAFACINSRVYDWPVFEFNGLMLYPQITNLRLTMF